MVFFIPIANVCIPESTLLTCWVKKTTPVLMWLRILYEERKMYISVQVINNSAIYDTLERADEEFSFGNYIEANIILETIFNFPPQLEETVSCLYSTIKQNIKCQNKSFADTFFKTTQEEEKEEDEEKEKEHEYFLSSNSDKHYKKNNIKYSHETTEDSTIFLSYSSEQIQDSDSENICYEKKSTKSSSSTNIRRKMQKKAWTRHNQEKVKYEKIIEKLKILVKNTTDVDTCEKIQKEISLRETNIKIFFQKHKEKLKYINDIYS